METRTTGIVIDPRFEQHLTGAGHPERPARIAALLLALRNLPDGFAAIEPRHASGDEIALVHSPAYVEEVAASAFYDRFAFDPDTQVSAGSFDTARLAAGALLALLDAIMARQIDNGFAFVRPPGHHAERHRAMGFCLFNNVAIGAEYLRRRYGFERILILDWDVHHGNGTQHMFERDAGVLYMSTHEFPFYPGTGAADEVGEGSGEGYTVNVPLPGGCGDGEYYEMFQRVVEPIAHQYKPQFVLISAGFDAHARDPLGGMQLSTQAYGWMTTALLRVAQEHAGGRCAAILEGGYDLETLCSSSLAVLDELRGAGLMGEPHVEPSRTSVLAERLVRLQREYWRL